MDLLDTIKLACLEAVAESQPCNIVFGKVVSVSPLQINVNQKLILTEEFLVLSKNVQDYEIDIGVSHYVDENTFKTNHTHSVSGTSSDGTSFSGLTSVTNDLDGTHRHFYQGRKKIKVYKGLQVGEEVLMIKVQGRTEIYSFR